LIAWVLTPFFIAPTLGVLTAMALATHPKIARPWVLVAVIASAVLSPIALELIGVTERSTFVVGGLILLKTTAAHHEQSATPFYAALIGYVVGVLAFAVVVARTMTNERRAAQKKAEIQAWQLRQLVV